MAVVHRPFEMWFCNTNDLEKNKIRSIENLIIIKSQHNKSLISKIVIAPLVMTTPLIRFMTVAIDFYDHSC